MNIAGTEFNLAHRAFEIYLSGCKEPHCKGCHNPELWDFSVGEDWQVEFPEIKTRATQAKEAGLAKYVWVLGGEPLHQKRQSLLDFLRELKTCGLEIVLWTRELSVPEDVASFCNYVKVGPYKESGKSYTEPMFGINLANPEQKIVRSNV